MNNQSNSRQVPRIVPPSVTVRVSTAERFRANYLKELSEGGLFIKTPKPLPIGRDLVIDLVPPGYTEPLRLLGAVVRHGDASSPGMGVQFRDMAPAVREALAALIVCYGDGPPPAPFSSSQSAPAATDLGTLMASLHGQERELALERSRNQELSRRCLELTDELEASRRKQSSADAKTVVGGGRELVDARMRVAELESNLSAYTAELDMLEDELAQSRRQSEALTQEKRGLVKEVERLSAELSQQREAAQKELKEVEGRMGLTLRETQEELDLVNQALGRNCEKLTALEAQLAEYLPLGPLANQESVPSEPQPPVDPVVGLALNLSAEPPNQGNQTTEGGAAEERTEFERRLRSNEELVKTARFDHHRPSDETEGRVRGLVQAAGRFSDLMVLARGLVTPAQLLNLLFRLHQGGALDFRPSASPSGHLAS